MNIKDLLLGLTTYPNIDAIKWSASFAELLSRRIAAFVADVKIEVPGSLLGNSLMNVSALAAAEMKKSKENAESLPARTGLFGFELLLESGLLSVRSTVVAVSKKGFDEPNAEQF
jgi:tetrahydromethanopterin S-methyltransferase subunit F